MTSADVTMPLGSVVTAEGFERAIRRLQPALLRYANRLTRDRTQSEDLVQETLLRAWAARHRFIPNSNFKAWLFRIERNCFLTVLRKSRRMVEFSPEMVELRLATPAMQEEGLMMQDLGTALASLPDGQSKALALINDEELQYADAADRMGIAIGTMKSRTARARTAVRTFLNGDASDCGKVEHRQVISADPVTMDRCPMPERSRYEIWKASGQRLIG